jgi:hypothetical protein
VTRAAGFVGLALVAACAHVQSPQRAVIDDGAAALRRCIADSNACPPLAMRLEQRLRDHYDTSAAHRLAWQMTEAFGRGDASVVGTAIVRCRAGHESSCRALWWALDRLYLSDDATLARANECGLTSAVVSSFEVER